MVRENDKPTVARQTIEQIKSMIASGRWGPGERLPGERQLAEELGVSRSSMREAIGALTAMGVIESRHGAGIYTTQLQAQDLLDAVGVAAEIWKDQDLLHLVEVRRILEASATVTATAKLTAAELGRLAELIEEMESLEAGDEFVAADVEFHRIIVNAAGNPVVSAMIDGMSNRTFRVRVMRGQREAEALRRTKDEHGRIYAALLNRDPEQARIAAAVHISGVEDWLRASLLDGEAAGPAS